MLVAATVLVVVWQISENPQLAFANQYVWILAMFTALILFLAASLIKITALLRSQKDLLRIDTERKQAEETLRESEARYRIVTESASDAILTIDQENTILFANSAAEKIFGYTVDELLGNKLFMLIPEHLRSAHTAGMKRYKETGKRSITWQGVELPAMHKDGHEVAIEVTFGDINNDSKHIFTAVMRDITERKRVKEELQHNLSLLTSTFEATAEGILVVDRNNKIVTYNKNFVEMVGIPDEVIRSTDNATVINFVVDQLVNPETFIENTKQLVLHPETLSRDTIEFKDGRIFERYSHPQILDSDVIGRVVNFRDITENKRAEIESRVISEIIQGVATTSNLEELLALVQKSIGQALYAENFYVALCDKQTEVLHVPFCADKFDVVAPPQKMGKGLTAYVFRTGCSALLTEADVNRLCEQGEVESVGTPSALWLGTPLRTPAGIIGVLVVQHYEDESAYTKRDVDLLSSAADQIALAIERKRAEEGLRQSEEKYRNILETIEEGYFETDLEGIFTFYNEALGEVLGYDTNELLGMHYRQYVDHRNAKKLFLSYVKVYRTRQPLRELNWEVIRKDGSRRFVESSITLIVNAAGVAEGFRGVVRDITERRLADYTLRESEANLAAAQRITHLGSWELDLGDLDDLSNNDVRWSDETYRIFGYEPGQIKVSNELFYNTVHPDDRRRVAQVLAEAIDQGKAYDIEHRVVLLDKSERTLHGQAELIFDKFTGRPLKLLGTVQDITESRRTDAALRDSEYKLRTLFTSMNEGLTQVDTNEVIEFVNDRLCAMTGYEPHEMLGKITLDLLFDDEGRRLVAKANEQRKQGISGQYEARLRKKSGEMLWVLISGAPIINADGELSGTLGMFMDISARKGIEEQLLHDAFHDGLTGLANRALFMDHLRLTIERCRSRHSNHYAVLFLDFDRFKVINDSLGHAQGDELLKQIARRLEGSTRTGDLLARLGGDEFVILLSEMIGANDAVQVAERIHISLKKPFLLSGNEVFISASIGVALSVGEHAKADEMLRDADIAMYRAKTKGSGRYQVFNEAMRDQATTRLQLETEMRQALERREFELHYQPIIDLETRALNGFEALVRWRHPMRGMIPPNDFIPMAEETGLILPLGRWILGESCRQMRNWQNTYPQASNLYVSVNLSCKQFLQSDLAEQVAETLETTGLGSRCLKLEITESYLLENSEKAIKIMNRLRALGVELSLDDFGTGYSSLSYLHRLPIDSIKIDRSFVSRMIEGEENNEIVRTIIKLAQNLKMKVVAEGIETAEQLDRLNRLKCGYGQGYLFSKPLKAERAEMFINENLRNLSGPAEGPVINLELNM